MSDDLNELGAEALSKISIKDKHEAKLKAAREEQEAKEAEEASKGVSAALKDREDLSPEEAEKRREEKIKRMTQVLNRGQLNDKLRAIIDSAVPHGRVGKFVRNTDESLIRYKNLGYTFQVNPKARGLHGGGDDRIKVGDLVLMTIDVEDLEVLREVRRRNVKKKLSIGRREYSDRATAGQSDGVVPFDESVQKVG